MYSASMPYLAVPTTQEHMKIDDIIIIGFIFGMGVEDKGYMKNHKHGMAK
jgi:hypothetical protein